MKKQFIIFLIISILLLPIKIFAEELFLTAIDNLPPYVYMENGESAGIGPELVREVCSILGINLKLQGLSWSRCLKMVQEGEADGIAGVFYTKERTEFLEYSSEPLITITIAVFTQKEKNIKISSLDDLKGKNTGVMRQYSYGSEFDSYPGLIKHDYYDNNELIQALLKNRIDAVAAHDIPFRFFMKKHGVTDYIKMSYTISETPAYIAFSKAIGERSRLLSEKFSQTVKMLKKEGRLQKIIDKHH